MHINKYWGWAINIIHVKRFTYLLYTLDPNYLIFHHFLSVDALWQHSGEDVGQEVDPPKYEEDEVVVYGIAKCLSLI